MKQFDTKLTEALQYKQETFAVGSQFPFGDLKNYELLLSWPITSTVGCAEALVISIEIKRHNSISDFWLKFITANIFFVLQLCSLMTFFWNFWQKGIKKADLGFICIRMKRNCRPELPTKWKLPVYAPCDAGSSFLPLSIPVVERWVDGRMAGFADRAKGTALLSCVMGVCLSGWNQQVWAISDPLSGSLRGSLKGMTLWVGLWLELAPPPSWLWGCLRQPELSSCDAKGFGFCLSMNRWALGLTLAPDSPKMSPPCWRYTPATPAQRILPVASCCHCSATQRASLAAPGKGSLMWIHIWHCFPRGFALEITPKGGINAYLQAGTLMVLQSFRTRHWRAQEGPICQQLMKNCYDSARRTLRNRSGRPGMCLARWGINLLVQDGHYHPKSLREWPPVLAGTISCLQEPRLNIILGSGGWGGGCIEVLAWDQGLSKACSLSPDPLGDCDFDFAAGLSLVLFLWQDLRPLYAGRCQYYSKSTTPPEVRAGPAVSC